MSFGWSLMEMDEDLHWDGGRVEVRGFALEAPFQEEPVRTGSHSVRPWPCS